MAGLSAYKLMLQEHKPRSEMATASKHTGCKPMLWVDLSAWGEGYWTHDGDITKCDSCAFGVTDEAIVRHARHIAYVAMPYSVTPSGRAIHTVTGMEMLERASALYEESVDDYHRRLVCVAKGVGLRTREAIAEAWSRVPL